MVTVVCVFFIVGFCIALYGWGLLLQQLTKYSVRNPMVTIVIGVSAVIFSGGVFNLLRVAYGWTFDIFLLVGVVLVAKFRKQIPELPHDKGERLHLIILGLFVCVIMGFTVFTQLPPKCFNYHDDFEKYFAHPVRMLQTGTLFGSPLSDIGFDTLGGQAVLHGIILNHFSIPYINGIDAVFGLFLCLTMSVSMIPLRATFLPISIVCLLTVFFINPQYVNVSSLYIGGALMMASILLFSNIHKNEEFSKDDGKKGLPPPILIGLIYASLIVTKSNFLLFPVLNLFFLIIAFKLSGMDNRNLIRWSVNTTCLTLLFLSPWILLHFQHYIRISPIQTPSHINLISLEYPIAILFSETPLYYGATFAAYTFLAMEIALAVIAFIVWSYREQLHSIRISLAGLAASGVTVVVAYPLIIFLTPGLGGFGGLYDQGLRCSIPFLIAGVPLIFSVDYVWSLNNSFRFKLCISTISLLLGIFILVCYSESVKDRIHQAYNSGSIISFSKFATSYEYINYNEEVFRGDTELRIAAAQNRIPAGQAVVACVMTPFYLDYKRNVIFESEFNGLISPWAYIPDVNYFMLEYSGFAVSDLQFSPKSAALLFYRYLVKMANNADILYNDGRIVVFKKHKDNASGEIMIKDL